MASHTGAMPIGFKSYLLALLDTFDTPLASQLKSGIKGGGDLPTYKVDPSCYENDGLGIQSFKDDFQLTELLRKRSFGSRTPKQRKDAALASWNESERSNYRTNLRLRQYVQGTGETDPARIAAIESFISRVKSEVARVVGRLPTLMSGRFSSGSGYGLGGGYPTLFHKVWQPSCTTRLAAYLEQTRWRLDDVGSLPHLVFPDHWHRSMQYVPFTQAFIAVDGEKFSTVPKNYETDRTIGVQPVVNLFFQLGIGDYLSKRLRAVAAIDLEYGQALHSELARKGSLDGSLATIDLRNASNSLCTELVRLFLPADWYWLLDLVRCDMIVHKQRGSTKLQRMEMFSAMGNGFTFPLQTLIFYSVCRAVGVERPWVYGDDIIVPTAQADDVIAALKWCGFAVNSDKTFTTGYFRESCGGNWFFGHDVTPRRIVDSPRCVADWYHLHNLAYDMGNIPAKRIARNQVPVNLRFGGPTHLGDIVLHGERWSRRWRRGIGVLKVYRPIPITWRWSRVFNAGFDDAGWLQSALVLAGAFMNANRPIQPHDPDNKRHPVDTLMGQRGVGGWKVGYVACSDEPERDLLCLLR